MGALTRSVDTFHGFVVRARKGLIVQGWAAYRWIVTYVSIEYHCDH